MGKIRRRRDRSPTPAFLAFPGGSVGKESACSAGDLGAIPGFGKIPLEEGMATHPSILSWRIPGTEEPWRAEVHGVAKSQTGPSG